ncbi:MAG: threonine synthase [Erythrobacter sp.]|nr:threonine synthase [Erythrobacter sp.]
MVALGFWQLGRADEKAALLARYSGAQLQVEPVTWPRDPDSVELALYRRAQVNCGKVVSFNSRAGISSRGAKGWAHYANCAVERQAVMVPVVIGWSRQPLVPDWRGGMVSGVIGPGPRLVADPPLAGLEPLTPPDPKNLPNNHLAYAVQWFLFALTALTIYGLALRKR